MLYEVITGRRRERAAAECRAEIAGVLPEERMQLLMDLGVEPEKPLITYCGGGP